MGGSDRPEFEEFVGARSDALQRFGYLLTGDWALAEDLLQTALARAYQRWSRIRSDNPEAYVKKIMVNTWSSWWRRRWRAEVPTDTVPETPARDQYRDVDRRELVRTALARLPSRQRAVLILRYHEDLTEHQVASLLGITPGTVKSQASRGLARLRADGAFEKHELGQA
jgi:RNA polymerase sigma-70 factor (sigma-E family)